MRTLEERFFEKVKKSSGCWHWVGCKNAGGYGCMRSTNNATALAHRISWQLARGTIPPGMDVLHTCDVPDCVNPAHLFIGDAATNMADMAMKGRHRSKTKPSSVARGESHYAAKLTTELVAYIRERAIRRGAQRSLARELGLSEATISLVVRGKRWC